jgi:hypothetical protein
LKPVSIFEPRVERFFLCSGAFPVIRPSLTENSKDNRRNAPQLALSEIRPAQKTVDRSFKAMNRSSAIVLIVMLWKFPFTIELSKSNRWILICSAVIQISTSDFISVMSWWLDKIECEAVGASIM